MLTFFSDSLCVMTITTFLVSGPKIRANCDQKASSFWSLASYLVWATAWHVTLFVVEQVYAWVRIHKDIPMFLRPTFEILNFFIVIDCLYKRTRLKAVNCFWHIFLENQVNVYIIPRQKWTQNLSFN